MQQCQVGGWVRSNNFCFVGLVIMQRNFQFLSIINNMVVGNNIPFGIDDDTRTASNARLLLHTTFWHLKTISKELFKRVWQFSWHALSSALWYALCCFYVHYGIQYLFGGVGKIQGCDIPFLVCGVQHLRCAYSVYGFYDGRFVFFIGKVLLSTNNANTNGQCDKG